MSFACTEKEARGAIALNYGSISMIDDAIGQVLGKLEELGLADNTIVIFTADHGDYMGDHQLLLKGAIHYQGLVRIPCIWMDPRSGDTGRTTDRLCGTIDLPTTFLDEAGVEPFNGMQGKILTDIAEGEDGYDSLVIEEDQRRSLMGFPPHYRVRSLITDRYRLSVYSCVDNLWDDPAHAGVKAELMERLARRLIDLADASPFCTGHGP
jgi:arylsulfatase A-like enzyme